MALYIKKDMLNVAKSANLTVDLTKLGKVQLNRLYKFLMSGNILGDGVPAQITRGLLREHQAPYIHESTWHVHWVDLPAEARHELQTVGSALKMASNGELSRYDSTQWLDNMVAGNPDGELRKYSMRRMLNAHQTIKDVEQPYMECIRAIKLTPSDPIKQIAEGIKARSITELSIQIFTGE